MKLTWLKFAARASSLSTIVPCWLPEMPRVVTKKALNPKKIEDAMRDVPERNPRIMALSLGEMCGHFYKRVTMCVSAMKKAMPLKAVTGPMRN